ncbi:hypothetical protein HYH03_015175 [Edaphochlamys debaryana]|uniref:Uncharacterized protein n=1 Tax=Edaphochlamys debaryana TaxID=47281 RepID=A0A835XLE0_9CHLO|nr:hypothetical protein HYH03_015175 [Edaphochlamys debaryana]|eukprot:KAG2486213.1 hypothetical protein HYH03_015175 [Edaphochlamys debaryana]
MAFSTSSSGFQRGAFGATGSSGDQQRRYQEGQQEGRQRAEAHHFQHAESHNRQRAENSTSGITESTAQAASGSQLYRTPLAGDGRFASLSRVLLVGQPGSMFRTLANRKWPSTIGPISLLVFLFGTIMALFAAVRGALVRKVKACKCCRGFGVVRCRLCDGRGSVDWRAKFSYSETCPLCAAKRFVVCPDCGGHYHRRLFTHAKGSKGTLESFFPGAAGAAAGVQNRPLD